MPAPARVFAIALNTDETWQYPLEMRMLHETFKSEHHIDAAEFNAISRINAARSAIELGLQRAKRPIVTTKFGPHSAVLLHLIAQVNTNVPVIWVDSGYNTEETRQYAKDLTENLDLNLHIYRPKKIWFGETPEHGDHNHKAFVDQIKLEPFARALADHNPDVWFTALRREQTELRSQLSLFQTNDQGILKVCPLLDWRTSEMNNYLDNNDLEMAFPAIDPTKAATHLECGLHERF